MIVIGVDTHKRTHTLVALDARTGVSRAQRTIPASEEGALEALRFGQDDPERVWAIEDCRHVSARLERALVAAGERVVRVAPALTGPSRKASRTPGKSDPIDAAAIALAAIRAGIDTLPVAFLDEQAMDIRVLADYREQLIVERTRLINRLRWQLVQIAPELEAQLSPASLKGARTRARLARQLARLPHSTRLHVAKATLRRITEITNQARELTRELASLIHTHAPHLLTQTGIGTATAATLIGHTAGAQRFPTDAHFARHSGTAPIPASSGQTTRHRLHRGGDRQLNKALHTIALVRARTDPTTRAYLTRKHAEGKTKREAIRCLKRHLARHIYQLLSTPTPPPPPTTGTAPPLTPRTR